MTADKGHEIVRSWDHNAASWSRVVRAGLIASRKAGTDAAMLQAIASCQLKRLLDIGCGEGWLVRAAVARTGCEAIGIDAAASLIADARMADPVNSYFTHTYEDFANNGGRGLGADFDIVAFNYSLFTDDVGPVLRAAAGRLTPGGVVIIQTLHPGVADPRHDGWRLEDFSAFAGEGWAPMPWYSRSLESWHAVLRDSGLAVRELREPETDGRVLSLLMLCGTAGR
jgi:2-polyprenyl-3-methyl-5-hydroxy-6-metoxy-1,4-benzoquinol methylase